MVSAVVTSIEPAGGSVHQCSKMLVVVVYVGGSAIRRRGYRHANQADFFCGRRRCSCPELPLGTAGKQRAWQCSKFSSAARAFRASLLIHRPQGTRRREFEVSCHFNCRVTTTATKPCLPASFVCLWCCGAATLRPVVLWCRNPSPYVASQTQRSPLARIWSTV